MLVGHSTLVEVLVHWVKQFKAGNDGRAPSEADIPEELGVLSNPLLPVAQSML